MERSTKEEVRRLTNKNMHDVMKLAYKKGLEQGTGLGILIGLIVSAVIYINL